MIMSGLGKGGRRCSRGFRGKVHSKSRLRGTEVHVHDEGAQALHKVALMTAFLGGSLGCWGCTGGLSM